MIYEITLDYIRGLCPVQHNNQDHLSGEIKLKERNIVRLFNEQVDAERLREAAKNDEPLMLGLIDKKELSNIFVDDKVWVGNLKAIIQRIGESFS